MIKIKFMDDNILRDVEFSRIAENVVQIIGDIERDVSGFKTYKSNGTEIGDFTEFKTIYRTIDGGFQFSNDGSVFPDPPIDPITFEKLCEKMSALEVENAGLLEKNQRLQAELETTQAALEITQESLTDTQVALCDVYEMIDMLGG